MPRLIFEIARDARGSLVHVRHRQSGECIGCIEVGLFEIVRWLVLEERAAAAPKGEERRGRRCQTECTPRSGERVL